MFDENVVFPENREVLCNSSAYFLSMPILSQPIMISKYLDLVFGTKQKVSPILQSSYQSQKFLVVDIVVPLGGNESFGVVPYWLKPPFVIMLREY